MNFRTTARTAGLIATAAFAVAAVAAPAATLASKPIDGEHKVTICHRTASDTNPYVLITVDVASAGANVDGHADEHQGPVWDATLKAQHVEWGDIIPAYTYGDMSFAGYNWTEAGQAIWSNGCTVAEPTEDVTPAPTEEPTATPTQEPEPTPAVDPTGTPVADPSADPTDAPSTDPVDATATPSPFADVKGITGAPRMTPPPTDTLAAATGLAGAATGSWAFVLAAIGSLLAILALAAPATKRARS